MSEICSICGKECADKRGLAIHIANAHKPDNTPPLQLSPEILEFARQEVSNIVKAELEKTIPEIESRIGENLSSILAKVDETIASAADRLAAQAQSEIERRFSNLTSYGGEGNQQQGLNNPIAQAIIARLIGGTPGGGDFTDQATKMGTALGAVLSPIISVWGQGVSQGLAAVNLAQRMGGGMNQAEFNKMMQEFMQNLPGMTEQQQQ